MARNGSQWFAMTHCKDLQQAQLAQFMGARSPKLRRLSSLQLGYPCSCQEPPTVWRRHCCAAKAVSAGPAETSTTAARNSRPVRDMSRRMSLGWKYWNTSPLDPQGDPLGSPWTLSNFLKIFEDLWSMLMQIGKEALEWAVAKMRDSARQDAPWQWPWKVKRLASRPWWPVRRAANVNVWHCSISLLALDSRGRDCSNTAVLEETKFQNTKQT